MSKTNPTYNNLVVSLTSKLARICAKAIERPLEKTGISLQEFKIIGLLIGEQNINQKALANKLLVKPATLSVAIDRLERKGTIQRNTSATDKRVNLLSLCKDVDLSEMNALLSNIEGKMLKGINQQDIDTTLKSLKKMIQNLENDEPHRS